MKTKIEKLVIHSTPLPDLTGFKADPLAWLTKQPAVGEPAWLLAYADDGVIWGKLEKGKLVQAADVFSKTFPRLEAETLQRAHFFGSQAEIRIWRTAGGLAGVRMEEAEEAQGSAFSRTYILWGNSEKESRDHWTWVEDGQLGIHQALPEDFPAKINGRPFQLQVRYYIEYEQDHGQARTAAWRLVGLLSKGGE